MNLAPFEALVARIEPHLRNKDNKPLPVSRDELPPHSRSDALTQAECIFYFLLVVGGGGREHSCMLYSDVTEA